MNSPVAFSLAARKAVAARGAVLARCVVMVMIGLGVFLRLHAFDFPTAFLFDEHHFVLNARNYFTGTPDQNDHPPLGKLIIATSIQHLGDNPVGWRVPGLLFGVATIVIGALAASRLFRSRDAGLFTAGLLCADGFLISYSRAALLDGYLTACVIAALWLVTWRVTLFSALLGGLLAGAACNIKFSGLGVLVPLLLAIALTAESVGRRALLSAIVLGTGAALYTAIYAFGLAYSRDSVSIADVWQHTAELFRHHSVLTQMENPWTSGWITWLLPRRPLVLGFALADGKIRALTCLGNLAIWWSSIALTLAAFWAIAMRGVSATLAMPALSPALSPAEDSLRPSAFVARNGLAVVLVLGGALGFLAPWVLTHRDSYIYHFLPTYACLVVLLGGYLGQALRHAPLGVAVFTLVILIVSLFYAPVWSFIPLSPRAYELRLFLPSWR